jgi:hypothetical protein
MSLASALSTVVTDIITEFGSTVTLGTYSKVDDGIIDPTTGLSQTESWTDSTIKMAPYKMTSSLIKEGLYTPQDSLFIGYTSISRKDKITYNSNIFVVDNVEEVPLQNSTVAYIAYGVRQ